MLETLGHGVLIATSRFWSTLTTVVLGSQDQCLIVDPGVYPDELAALADQLDTAGHNVEAGFATHAHWDHVLWHASWHEARRFVTGETSRVLARHRAELIDPALVDQGSLWDTDLVGRGMSISGVVPWSGPTAVVVESDAHMPGHGSLHFPELGLLCAGDLVSDVDVPFPFWGPPHGLAEGLVPYRIGLDRIAAVTPIRRVVPGHGGPTNGPGFLARLDADRRYLDRLDAAVANSVTLEEALERTETIDGRLANIDVASAHERTVKELFREWSTS